MMPTGKSQPNTPQSGKTKTKFKFWHTFKRLLIVTSMLGLMTSNILTLINDDIHTMGFNALKAILTPVVADTTLSRLLSNSPTQKQFELKRVSMMRTNIAKKVSTRITRRAVANAVKNASSFVAEIVPVGGIAIIVGLTASDIYDDCQTIKDLNELNVTFEHEKEDETSVCGMNMSFLNTE
jgi:hypothetical protein